MTVVYTYERTNRARPIRLRALLQHHYDSWRPAQNHVLHCGSEGARRLVAPLCVA